VAKFLESHTPDVLCLQETKVINDLFPGDPLAKLAMSIKPSTVRRAITAWLSSRACPLRRNRPHNSAAKKIPARLGDLRERRRAPQLLRAGRRRHSRPQNEREIATSSTSCARCHIPSKTTDKRSATAILVGDLNVAPLENDVWSHKQLLGIVSHTPVETGLLGEAKAAFDWIDITRSFVPESEKIYSWWSYRAQDWAASDRGAGSIISG